MKAIVENPFVVLAARLVLAVIFISYGVEKILAPKDFAHNVLNYQLMPLSWVNIYALVVPWIELISGVMLLVGLRLKAASALTGLLLVSFLVAILSALARGLEINCGCSANPEPVGIKKIVEDLLYLAIAVAVYRAPKHWWTLEEYAVRRSTVESVQINQPA